MSGSIAKNYHESGDRWIVKGEIDLQDDGKITKDGEPIYYTKAEVDNLIQQLRDELSGGDGA